MESLNQILEQDLLVNNLVITALIVGLLIICQRLTLRYVAKKKWASETIYLRVHTHVRNAFLVLIAISIFTIWIPQIQAFALSVAAIAVALVISMKEIITMLTGGIIRSSTDLLSIGDRVEINTIKGDVMKVGFLTTDLLEVGECGQRTGRIVHIPNNYFYTYHVINETAVRDFAFHVITLPLPASKYSSELKQNLLDYTKDLTAEYVEKAADQFRRFARKNAISGLNAQPRILVKPYTFEQFHLILRVPIPIREKIQIEQKIIDKFAHLIG